MALTAVLTVVVPGHKDTRTALRRGALTAQLLHRAIVVDAVVLERSHLDLAVLVLDLLGGRVDLLLTLLGTTTQAKHQVQRRLLLDCLLYTSDAADE